MPVACGRPCGQPKIRLSGRGADLLRYDFLSERHVRQITFYYDVSNTVNHNTVEVVTDYIIYQY